MKKHLLFALVGLTLYQTLFSDAGKAIAQNAVPDTITWKWEVSSTVSTRTKTCTIEFSDNLLINWGDGVTEWIPDSMSSKAVTHVYTAQANFDCTAVGVGISYFKADSRRLLNLDVTKSPGLTYLSFTSNQIASLDLTKNPSLVSLYCGGNNIKALDLSQNRNLQTLTCSDNQLSSLDFSMLPVLKKVTCHTNPLVHIDVHSAGALNYLSCSGCNLTAESLDSIFVALPRLTTVSTSKNLYVLSNPGSSSCHTEIAAAKNWTLDRVITQSSFYIPSVSCKSSDSIRASIYLKNTDPALAFEMDVLVPDGFTLDTSRCSLSAARKGQHMLSIARISGSPKIYKFMAYSMKTKDVFSGTDGAVLDLFLKAPAEMKTYTLDIQKAILLDSLTNVLDLSVTDGQMIVGASTLSGDANSDGNVDVTDVVNLVAWINGLRPTDLDSAAMDVDGNGFWNISDITKMVVIINSSGAAAQHESGNNVTVAIDALSLYPDEAPVAGNNLYIRQANDDASCLEVCLDNKEEVQAYQADLFLPKGLSLQEGTFTQQSERNTGQVFSVFRRSLNSYRILSYPLKTNAAYSGNSGVLSRLQILGSDQVTDGTYPVVMRKAVLTGMNLKSVSSNVYDALVNIESSSKPNDAISFGADAESHLWVQGTGLLEVTVWDVAGKLVAKQQLDGADHYSVPLNKGFYLVKAVSKTQQACYQKVAVK